MCADRTANRHGHLQRFGADHRGGRWHRPWQPCINSLARDHGNADGYSSVARAQLSGCTFMDECAACATLHVATDDGSYGFCGLVTAAAGTAFAKPVRRGTAAILCILQLWPGTHGARGGCGAAEVLPVMSRSSAAIDYLTKCGVGICGACATPDGRRLCVDGPFLSDAARYSLPVVG